LLNTWGIHASFSCFNVRWKRLRSGKLNKGASMALYPASCHPDMYGAKPFERSTPQRCRTSRSFRGIPAFQYVSGLMNTPHHKFHAAVKLFRSSLQCP
jgi:hypothetical protein